MLLTSRLLTGLAALAACAISCAGPTPVVIEEVATPSAFASPEHQRIHGGIGEWSGHITMYIPGAPEPLVEPCSEVVVAVGDLWTTSRFEMVFMGDSFTGTGAFGYDPVKQKYISTWVDSSNPTLTIMEGVYDEAKATMVMHYDMYEPMSEQVKQVRSEHVQRGNNYTLSFFDLTAGGETLTMKIEMKRD